MADGTTTLGIHHLNKNEGADAVNRLMGSAFFRDYPANVLGVGIAPGDEDKRAVVLVKTNADDGVLEGGLITGSWSTSPWTVMSSASARRSSRT